MQIDRRIQIEGMRLDDGKYCVEPREGKSNEEINAYRAENRLRLRLFAHKNAAKDNYDGENVKCEAENDGEDRPRYDPGSKNDRVFHDRRNRKNQSDKDETFPEAHRVYAHQREGGAHQPEHPITYACITHVWVQSKVYEQKQKQQKE